MPNHFDLVIIGAGPGGYVAAIRAAQLGAKVALIEKDQVGGTCLNRGCIPTKALIACINLFEQIKKAENFGITVNQPSIDLPAMVSRKNKIVAKLVKGVELLLSKNKVEIIRGEATVLASEKEEIRKLEIRKLDSSKLLVVSSKLILATGSSPICLPGTTFDNDRFLCSSMILDNFQVPEKLDIVGGGVIGLHFAHIYSSLGSSVTIHEALPEILPGVDEEIIALVKRVLKRKNVNILTNSRFDLEKAGEKTLICVGRKPNLAGLENLNLRMAGKSVWVNKKMETSLPGIYAIGDLVSEKLFAHVAYEQGIIAAENALGANKSFTYDYVPYGIYIHPEIGAVGLTEKQAKEKYANIKVGKFPFAALGIAQAMGEIEGFIKIISDEAGKLLGLHIVGPEATALIGAGVIALKNNLSVDQLAATIQAHPSYPEGLQEASLSALSQSLHTLN